MKKRLRFKLIALLIITALAGLIAFQAYWLKGLYETLYSQMESDIQESMRLADYKEMFFRLEEYKAREGLDEYSSQINIKEDIDKEEVEKEGEEVNKDSSFIDKDEEGSNIDLRGSTVDKATDQLLSTINNFGEYILQGMHQEIDTLISIRFHMYDSILGSELRKRDIEARYQLNLVYEMSDNHTVFQTLSKNYPGKKEDTTAAALDWKNSAYYDYPVMINAAYLDIKEISDNIMDTPLYYRLYLKNPERIILRQMTGILFSSFSVFIIIVIAFIYLLRTILRQKTEEELKTDFTNNMTHELKTPISVSYAAVDSLLNYGEPVTDKQHKYLSIVKEQLNHLTGLVEQILTLSVENRTTMKLRPESIHVKELIDKLIEQNRMKSGKEIHFIVEMPDNLMIYADRTHFYNMISNLLDNAIKYTDKTPVIIRIKGEHLHDEITLSIEDNGPGISLTHQTRIFDRFYRIPSGNLHNVKGHGLGLYYVKDMMNKHRGKVTIDSIIGKGSIFRLQFPAR